MLRTLWSPSAVTVQPSLVTVSGFRVSANPAATVKTIEITNEKNLPIFTCLRRRTDYAANAPRDGSQDVLKLQVDDLAQFTRKQAKQLLGVAMHAGGLGYTVKSLITSRRELF